MMMNKTKILPLFFYGTLRSQDVRDAVLNKDANKLILSDAYLIGFKLFKVKNANYPLIIKDSLSEEPIPGYLVKGLDKEIIRQLDLFEGDNYSRYKVYAYETKKKIKISCEIYMPNKSLAYTDEWIFEDWCKLNKNNFFEIDFNKKGILGPR